MMQHIRRLTILVQRTDRSRLDGMQRQWAAADQSRYAAGILGENTIENGSAALPA
jgi:hypothetical protein